MRGGDVLFGKAQAQQIIALDGNGGFALGADGPDEALGEDGLDGGGDEERLDSHVNQTCEGAGSVVGVERAEDQVPGEGGADGDLGGFEVADFADHDHVGVLAEDVAQAHGEGQADVAADGDLVDALQFVFDRLLNGDDALGDGIDGTEKGVEGGGFAGAGRARDEENAVGLDDDLADVVFLFLGEAEFLQAQENFAAGEEAQGDAFAIDRGDGGNADVNFLPLDADIDATVLGEAFFGDVHAGHDLDAGDERRLVTLQLRRHGGLMEDAVNAIADAQLVLLRLEMDVSGAVLEGLPNDLVDELDDAGFLVAFRDFLVLDQQFQRLVGAGHFVQGFSANPVVLFEGLFQFVLGGEGEGNRLAGVELDGVEHGGVERVADGDEEAAVLEFGGEDGVLEGDFGGNLLAGIGRDIELGNLDERPAERLGERLEENVLGGTAFAGDETEQGLGRACLDSSAPRLAPDLELPRAGQVVLSQKAFDRDEGHALLMNS